MQTRLIIAAAAVAVAVATTPSAVALAHPAAVTASHSASSSTAAGLPVREMERIMQSDGTVSSGVLDFEITRPDLHVTGGNPPVRFKTGFQIVHGIFFQSLGSGKAILNGDVALKAGEIQPVIDTLLSRGIAFQAEHQHFYDLSPMVWFIHFRKTGDPLRLARDARAVVATTSTPLPQHSPAHPTTPLPAQRLGAILGGDATVGENGVVTVTVPRRHGVLLGGVRISPELNVATAIEFQPLGGAGRAAVAPDFSLTASEIQPVMRIMRGYGWEVGCLYNQETDEHPQLYFSHQFKTGDPIRLAREMRQALDRTDAGL